MIVSLIILGVGLLIYAGVVTLNRRPDKHQECLKRIYEMEQKMPEIEGIPWVYRNELEGLWLSWEEFPLEVYEPKKIEPIPVQYTQIYPSVKVRKVTAEDIIDRWNEALH